MSTPVLSFAPFGTQGRQSLNSELERTIANRRRVTFNIEATQAQIDSIPESTINAVGDARFIDRKPEVVEWPFLSEVLHIVRDHHVNLPRRRATLADLQDSYRRYVNDIVSLQRQIAKGNDGDKHFTQTELDKIMERVPNTTAKGLGGDLLQLTFSDVWMTPDQNPYYNVNKGQRPAIKLADVTALVHLHAGSVTMTSDTLVEGGFGSQAHPHLMSRSNPCLGGFEGTFYDACQKVDIEVIALVLRMWLSQANNGDAAGKYWPRWMKHDIYIPQMQSYYQSVGNLELRSFINYTITDGVTTYELADSVYVRSNRFQEISENIHITELCAIQNLRPDDHIKSTEAWLQGRKILALPEHWRIL